MKTIILLAIALMLTCEGKNQNIVSSNSGIYIFEYSSKIIGQAIIGFVITNDSAISKITFKIYYTNEKISKIKKEIDNQSYQYTMTKDNDIYLNELNLVGYKSENFKNKKIHSDYFYKLISKDFLELSNTERLKILQQL